MCINYSILQLNYITIPHIDLASYTSDVDSLFGMVPAAVQESSSQVVAARESQCICMH